MFRVNSTISALQVRCLHRSASWSPDRLSGVCSDMAFSIWPQESSCCWAVAEIPLRVASRTARERATVAIWLSVL